MKKFCRCNENFSRPERLVKRVPVWQKIKPDRFTDFNELIFLSSVFKWPSFVVFHLLIDEPEDIKIVLQTVG